MAQRRKLPSIHPGQLLPDELNEIGVSRNDPAPRTIPGAENGSLPPGGFSQIPRTSGLTSSVIYRGKRDKEIRRSHASTNRSLVGGSWHRGFHR